MANKIIAAIVHDLKRADGEFDVKIGKAIDPDNALTQSVVDELSDRYDKGAFKAHGKFSANDDDYPTQKNLRAYLVAGEKTFDAFAAKLMETLKVQARRRPNVTPGHVFYAHIERDRKPYLLVAIVSDRVSAALTGNLELEAITHLDLDHFRFAGRIDIDGWQGGGARYIGFIRGRGDISDYFREFLGCEAIVGEKQDTVRPVNALSDFTVGQGMEPEARGEFLSKAKTICDRAVGQNKELEFKALANELMPDNPDPLVEALANPDLALTDGFVPQRAALSPLVQFKFKTPSVSLAFDRTALNRGDIIINADDTLTVQNLPEEFVQQLRGERRDAEA